MLKAEGNSLFYYCDKCGVFLGELKVNPAAVNVDEFMDTLLSSQKDGLICDICSGVYKKC